MTVRKVDMQELDAETEGSVLLLLLLIVPRRYRGLIAFAWTCERPGPGGEGRSARLVSIPAARLKGWAI